MEPDKARTGKKFGKKSATAKRKKWARKPEFFISPYTDKLGISRRYGVSLRTVDAWLQQKIIPVIKINRVLRFSVDRCDAALARFEVAEIK